MKYYGYFRSSAAYRLRIALNLKGLSYEYLAVDLRSEQHLAAAFKSLNPQRLVPALEVAGIVLTQSVAILEWLDERFPDPPLLPADANGRAIVRGMVPAATTTRMREVAAQHLVEPRMPVEFEADTRYPGAPASREAPGGRTVRRLLQAYARDAVFREWAVSPLIAARLQQLLRGTAYLSQAHHNCIMTKNPAYSDVLYVESLIGADTINTVPDATLAAFRDHGKAADTLGNGTADAQMHFDALAKAGIDMHGVGETLQTEGVKLFVGGQILRREILC